MKKININFDDVSLAGLEKSSLSLVIQDLLHKLTQEEKLKYTKLYPKVLKY